MFHRKMKKELLEAAKGYPVVTLMGPRQSGKTTGLLDSLGVIIMSTDNAAPNRA